jgi:hypothetical protein
MASEHLADVFENERTADQWVAETAICLEILLHVELNIVHDLDVKRDRGRVTHHSLHSDHRQARDG